MNNYGFSNNDYGITLLNMVTEVKSIMKATYADEILK